MNAKSEVKKNCHYTVSVWNTRLKKTTRSFSVIKNKHELTEKEIGKYGCTVCVEDQDEVVLKNGIRFQICAKTKRLVERVLNQYLDEGGAIFSVVGYRTSRSRGPLNKKGERTLMSHHSFGTSLDINSQYNGLYSKCVKWGKQCNLVKGGIYSPEGEFSFTSKNNLVKKLKEEDFYWGGENPGNMKDFMHFSLEGY